MSYSAVSLSLRRISRLRWHPIALHRGQYALHATQLSRFHHEQVVHRPHCTAVGSLSGARHYSSSTVREATTADDCTSGQTDGHQFLADQFHLINPALRQQVQAAFPHFNEPALAQALLWQTMRKESDVLFRAHTGSGKSLGLLIALLDRIPDLHGSLPSDTGPHRTTSIIVVPTRPLAQQYAYWAEQLLPPGLRASMESVLQVTHEKRIDQDTFVSSAEGKPIPHIRIFTVAALKAVLTSSGSSRPDGDAAEAKVAARKVLKIMNIRDLKTLILDEPDAMFNLPGRFEYQEMAWKRKLLWTGKGSHTPPLIDVMNIIMSKRRSFSAGPAIDEAVSFDKSVMGPTRAAKDKPRRSLRNAVNTGPYPLQLVIVGASVNSVVRKFLSHRSGWLITSASDLREDGKWIDLTGMTSIDKCAQEVRSLPKELLPLAMAESQASEQIPRSIRHCCVVVDEPSMRLPGEASKSCGDNASQSDTTTISDMSTPNSNQSPSTETTSSDSQSYTHQLRNLDTRLSSSSYRLDAEDEQVQGELLNVQMVAPRPMQKQDPRFDFTAHADFALLSALAYIWAKMDVRRGLAILPDGWALDKAKQALCRLGVSAVNTDDAIQTKEYHVARNEPDGGSKESEQSVLHLVKRSNIRGIDIAGGISHAFLLGFESVQDSASYVHLAGRVSRMNSNQLAAEVSEQSCPAGEIQRPPGTVVTLLQGVDDDMRRKNMAHIRSNRYDDQWNGQDEYTPDQRDKRADLEMQSEEAIRLGHGDREQSRRIMKQLMLDRPKRISSTDEVRMAGLYKSLNLTLDRVEPLPLSPHSETGALRRHQANDDPDVASRSGQQKQALVALTQADRERQAEQVRRAEEEVLKGQSEAESSSSAVSNQNSFTVRRAWKGEGKAGRYLSKGYSQTPLIAKRVRKGQGRAERYSWKESNQTSKRLKEGKGGRVMTATKEVSKWRD